MAKAKYIKWITEEGQQQIRDWIKEGLLDREIAERMDTSAAVLANWKRKYKKINEAFRERESFVEYHKDTKTQDLSQQGKRDGLTTMQQLFCDYYIDSRDVLRSYIKAYYESQGRTWDHDDLTKMRTSAYMLRKNKKVQKYINQVIKDRRESDAMQPDDIVMRLTEMIQNPASDANTALKAMDLLGKHYKMFNQLDDSNKAQDVIINLSGFKVDEAQ